MGWNARRFLKLREQISRLMDVSLNTLLGCPRALYCQSCGMPLADEFLGRDSDGALNEKFRKQ